MDKSQPQGLKLMDLKEPKRKKRVKDELKSALPLVFGRKGDLTIFHANLSALGTSIADPTEMEMIYKMGYFGKGSLSKSYPSFGRSRYGAPPVISTRQYKCREKWIKEVQKLSTETCFDSDKNEINNESRGSLKNLQLNHSLDEHSNTEEDDIKKNINGQSVSFNKSSNGTVEPIENISETKDKKNNGDNDTTYENNSERVLLNQEKNKNDIEIIDSDIKNKEETSLCTQIEVDEVVLDSTEEEDICEVSDTYENREIFTENEDREMNCIKDQTNYDGKLLVLPDSDTDDIDNYLKDIKPEVKSESFPVRETLHLTFEETFFLMYGLGCLRLVDIDGRYLNIGETWNYFCKEQKDFLQKYVVYHYFRSKGWIVKPGLKYGADYLLYKEGPPFYHSSYVVIIDVLDAVTFKRVDQKSMRKMMWHNLIGMERLAESANKEILFAQVLWPSSIALDLPPNSPECLSQFTIREILWRRWKINQNSLNCCNESDNEDDNESS